MTSITIQLGGDVAATVRRLAASQDIMPTAADLTRCRELIAQYRDLGLRLADASVVATAECMKTARLFTLDERHFRAVQPRGLGHFILLPADRP